MFFLLSSCFGQIEVEPKIEVTPDSSFRFEMTTTKTGYMVNKFIGTESKVRIPEKYNDKPVIYILSEAFANNDVIEEIVIPNTIIDMWGAVFKGCTNLTKVTIPASVKSIAPITFQDCVGLETINVEKDNPNYRSIDGAVYSKDGKTLIIYPAGKTGKINFNKGITKIDDLLLEHVKL
jgi:hypothetical protein